MVGFSGFDWDRGNLAKFRKHGVSIAEIEELFESGPTVAPDLRHSTVEDRYIAVGRNREGRPLFVAFTLRRRGGRMFLRPLSARYMHKKEIAAYEREEKGSKV
jgi:uncharacterized DUF497 family protein